MNLSYSNYHKDNKDPDDKRSFMGLAFLTKGLSIIHVKNRTRYLQTSTKPTLDMNNIRETKKNMIN